MTSGTSLNAAAASLIGYNGSAGVLVDTNVWVDCIDKTSSWHEWAVDQLQISGERSPLHVNLIIYTALLLRGPDVQALKAVSNLSVLTRDPAGYASYFPRLTLIGS
jgi:hypothetical protein